MGGQSKDGASGGQGLFADGTAGREYADVVWRGEESISPSSAGYDIRASNDQGIFAWFYNIGGGQPGSVLADDPSCFRDRGGMELMDSDEFIRYFKKDIPEEELETVEDRLGTFPITNRGIRIWLLLRPDIDSCTLFETRLPCRNGPWEPPVTIDLVLWGSNYYRCSYLACSDAPLRFHQVYLRYQDPSHRSTTFEIDDSALTENGFTCCAEYP